MGGCGLTGRHGSSRQVTISMVAHAAGVSTATVSHVLNETRYVSPETRERVMKAVRELRYRPNALAQSLRRQRSDVIGVVVPDLSNAFFPAVFKGIQDVALKQHFGVLLCNTDEDPAKEMQLVQMLVQRQVAGLILTPTGRDYSYLEELVLDGLRVVMLDRRIPNLDVPSVLVANEQAAYEATGHLIRLGHRRIGLIGGLPGLTTTEERLAGYRGALAEAGIIPDEGLIRLTDSRYEGGYQAAHALLDLADPPTAIFAANGPMTIGVMKALRERSIACPEEVAVVGFDDFDWASTFRPYLTTVAQPTYQIGVAATRILLQRSTRRPKQVTLTPSLIIRESCGAALAAQRTAKGEEV